MSNFYERKLVRTGREHRCEYCGAMVQWHMDHIRDMEENK